MRQRKGEMVVTWPLAYHQGWNDGPNVCEAIGYGTKWWKEEWTGKRGERVYRPCCEGCAEAGSVVLDFPENGDEEEEEEGSGGKGRPGKNEPEVGEVESEKLVSKVMMGLENTPPQESITSTASGMKKIKAAAGVIQDRDELEPTVSREQYEELVRKAHHATTAY